MKYLTYISMIALSLSFFGCDNDELSELQADSFIKFYGAEMGDEGRTVITLDDGYLIMGNIETPPENYMDIFVFRTDKYGNTVQSPLVIGGRFDDVGFTMVRNEAGFVIAGFRRKTDFGDKDAYVVQINEQASEIIWEVDTGYNLDDELRDILILDNGNIVCCGYSEIEQNNIDEGKNFSFFEINSEGNVISMSNYGGQEDQEANAIVKATDTYILAGWASMPLTSETGRTKRPLAVRWTGGAQPGLPHYFYEITDDLDIEIIDIIPSGADEFYLACNIIHPETNESEIQVIKTDARFEQHNYYDYLKYGEYTINRVSEMKVQGSKIYLTGTSFNAGNKGDMFVLETGLDGTDPHYFYEGDGSSFVANGFDLTDDGGFILTGAAHISDQSAITLSKISR